MKNIKLIYNCVMRYVELKISLDELKEITGFDINFDNINLCSIDMKGYTFDIKIHEAHLNNVFELYLKDEINEQILCEWCNFIYMVDDFFDVSGNNQELIYEILCYLSDPYINEPITKKLVLQFKNDLEKSDKII